METMGILDAQIIPIFGPVEFYPTGSPWVISEPTSSHRHVCTVGWRWLGDLVVPVLKTNARFEPGTLKKHPRIKMAGYQLDDGNPKSWIHGNSWLEITKKKHPSILKKKMVGFRVPGMPNLQMSKSYCWCFRNLKNNLGCLKPCK